MNLFNKIKNVIGINKPKPEVELTRDEKDEDKFVKINQTTHSELDTIHTHFWDLNLNNSKQWTHEVRNWPDKEKVRFALWLAGVIHQYNQGNTTWGSGDRGQQLHAVCLAFLFSLFRNKLLMDDEDATLLFAAFTKKKLSDWSHFTSWPIGLMIPQLEKQRAGQRVSPELIAALEGIKKDISNAKTFYHDKERIKLMDKIDGILFSAQKEDKGIKPARFLGDDPFGTTANSSLAQLPEPEKQYWYQLLPLAQKATGARPPRKYLEETKALISKLGPEKFRNRMQDWLRFLISMKEKEEHHAHDYGNGQTYQYTSYEFLTSVNMEAVKGLIWACSHVQDSALIQTLSAMAERAFRKIPGKGPAAASLGNACLYVLSTTAGLEGIGHLSRLKLRIRQGSTQALIEKYLKEAAENQGVTVEEIEDMAVDDFGFENACRSFAFGEYKAVLQITGVGKTEIKWFKPDGHPQKTVPAVVKEEGGAGLKEMKEIAKQVEQTVVAQRDRIDRMFRTAREIPWDKFEQYYLHHGLMCFLARGIIWNIHRQDKTMQVILWNHQWVNAAHEVVHVEEAVKVSLWHPVKSPVSEIKAWREFLEAHQLLQPLKQAYREVYLITEAELQTRIYSNRMAAHILRQHQFNSLAKARGWRYSLLGAYDDGRENEKASLQLPEHHLMAQFWISEVNADGAFNDTGIWNFVSTDQVRFLNTSTGNTVDLVDIPPLVFSEVMRDVDLFVGVASVGNDPAWQDSGGLPAYRDYWTSYSFGDLSEIARNRKEILGKIIPRLKIKDVTTINEKFLVVRGKLRTYKIHIGSTNILMEPNDQYLCIVPDRSRKDHTENVFLPFEGDNGLSIILSKAFLLADDDKITDPTITSQINRI